MVIARVLVAQFRQFKDDPIGYICLLPRKMRRILNGEFAATIRVQKRYMRSESLLQGDEPEAAWKSIRGCLKFNKDPGLFLFAALCLIAGLGRFKEGVSVFAQSNRLRSKKVSESVTTRIRFLDHTWVTSFGHIAEIDYPIKLGILEGLDREDTILYVRPGTHIANKFLLEMWRPHLKIVEREADLPLPLESLQAFCFDFRGPLLANGSTEFYWKAAADVYRRWHAENRPPILRFPSDLERLSRLTLERAGIPKDAWFVTLHVREAGFKKLNASLHNVLNANVADYQLAIDEITRRGGWVIRIGDPSMTPLQPARNVFDYTTSNIRSEWMDVYLLMHPRFFLGTSSGPAYVPQDCDVPCVLTNWWPPAQRPWHPHDIFVPKLYRRVDTNALLSLSASLAEPFGYCHSVKLLRNKFGVTVEDNSPSDILAATCEMLDRLDGVSRHSAEARNLQTRADQIYRANGGFGMASVSCDFLRTHASSFLN